MSAKISELPTRVAIQNDDLLVLANDATALNYKITILDLKTQIGDITMALYKKELDEVSSSTSYLGEAIPGTLHASASWRIARITFVGNDVTVEYADNGNFSQIWDNRLSLSYN